eukprot:NODE_80_length_22759_cov_1.466858.p12 type:complete len:196 gc:universal NODE_80_length_22759_cov_1.466858:11897-11310(-)
MFTGIVEVLGIVNEISNYTYTFEVKTGYLADVNIGDSIAVNGTCLTVTYLDKSSNLFKVDTTPETLKCTSLGSLGKGSKVNLEKALMATSRMGGHFVQGHVDCTVEILKKFKEENSIWFQFSVDKLRSKYIIEKGFVCLDGVSLTACNVQKDNFSIMMIPHTAENTALFEKKVGDKVNLEVDMLSKMVERHKLFQ